MDQIEAMWICSNCHEKNFVTYNPNEIEKKLYSCCHCGKLYGKFQKTKSKNWLYCLPWHGVGSKLPKEVNMDAATGETTWTDPSDGRELTRTDYAKKYGWDPLIIWCRLPRNRNHPVCKELEDQKSKSEAKCSKIREELFELGIGTDRSDRL